jgi:beta-barrel assembly-enhancing protease
MIPCQIRAASVLSAIFTVTLILTPVAEARAPSAGGAQNWGKVLKRAEQLQELQITEAEEIQLGAAVSEKVRTRYGVVQDNAVHRYVSLVGRALVQKSSRPNLAFTFVVLDTDGVNAFAAPGGYVHITRGALALMQNEAELAGVLAHEIDHVTEKHTIHAMQKGKLVQMGAQETLKNPEVFGRLVDKTTELVLTGFGRNEELEADREGLQLATSLGYSPLGLAAFLKRLADRNAGSKEKQGLFASHPEMNERLTKLAALEPGKPSGNPILLADRYRANITYTPKALTEITPVGSGSAGLAGGSTKSTEPKKKGFGLGGLLKPGGTEKKSTEVTGSGASRGVDTERNAKGGAVKTLVAVNITPAEIAQFKKEGGLK